MVWYGLVCGKNEKLVQYVYARVTVGMMDMVQNRNETTSSSALSSFLLAMGLDMADKDGQS